MLLAPLPRTSFQKIVCLRRTPLAQVCLQYTFSVGTPAQAKANAAPVLARLRDLNFGLITWMMGALDLIHATVRAIQAVSHPGRSIANLEGDLLLIAEAIRYMTLDAGNVFWVMVWACMAAWVTLVFTAIPGFYSARQ